MADPEVPFLAFRFRVRFDGDSLGGFSECTGLSLEFQTLDYEEGGRNGETLKFPTRGRQGNIVLKRGVVNRRLWDWYFRLLRGERNFRKSGSIEVLDAAGAKPEFTLEVSNAFPCKWIGPDLNASQSNVAVESLELCHEGLLWV
jgi:phage tail-like protein